MSKGTGEAFLLAFNPLMLTFTPFREMGMRVEGLAVNQTFVRVDGSDINSSMPGPVGQRTMAAPALNLGKVDKQKHRILRTADLGDLAQRFKDIFASPIRSDLEEDLLGNQTQVPCLSIVADRFALIADRATDLGRIFDIVRQR
ncbi:hypothetical protein AX761_22990 [Rhizobium sp. 58]|nr:hypothetical protein AX761_22990 [Rhizobium sp. 58]